MKLLTYLQVTKQVTRRDFEQMLKEEVIYLNNEQVTSFSQALRKGDEIRIQLPNGEAYVENVTQFPTMRTKIMLFHKPKGYVVSKKDPHNKTIYDLLPDYYRSRYYVGRLDKNSTGLLLLTNDPQLVDLYENPRHSVSKVYKVRIDKPFKSSDTKKACTWIRVDEQGNRVWTDEGEFLKCNKVSYHRDNKKRYRLTIILTAWKKRHIRRILKALGYKVKKLHRVKVDKRELGDTKPGNWQIKEIRKKT